MIIVYSDASVKDHDGAGIGWHLQSWGNDSNTVLTTIDKGSDFLSGKYSSMEAELLALTRAVKEALKHGERGLLMMRTDCHPLVEKINAREPLRDGSFIEALYALLDSVDDWEIKWVKRDKNSLADRQAVAGREQKA